MADTKKGKTAAKKEKAVEKKEAGATSSGMVSTPSGPQPVSAVARNEEEAEKLLEAQAEAAEESRRPSVTTFIEEEDLERMSANEIRAVASDRGYDLGPRAGRHRTRTAFQAAQDEDDTLEKPKEESEDDEKDKKGSKKSKK